MAVDVTVGLAAADGLGDLMYGLAELEAARPAYAEAGDYYKGRVDEVFASPRIARAVAATGERYRFALAKTPVKVLASRVKLAAVTVPGDQAASELIAEIWTANDLDVQAPELHLRCFEYGDAYLMVWPYEPDPAGAVPATGDEPGAVEDDPLAVAGVEMVYNSPECVRVIYDPENQRRKLFAIKRWRCPGGECRADLYYPDRIERYVTKPGAGRERTDWYPYREEQGNLDEPWPLPNPTGAVPFFHFRTGLPYGEPVHVDAYGPQDAINKMLITQITTTDSHGWPQRYQLTDAGADLDHNNDDPDWDDDADADDATTLVGGVSSGQRSGPGTIQTFTGTREVGQFAAADPHVFLDPVELYVRLMAQTTDMPLYAFYPSGDVPSGESRRAADVPLNARVGTLQTLLRGPWQAAWKFALRLAGHPVTAVDVRWQPSAVVEDADFWATQTAKQAAGVPQRQTLIEAAYSAEQVDGWLDQKPEAMDLARRVGLLGQIGTAVSAIGSAVALGVLDETQARALVEQLVGQLQSAGDGTGQQ